MEKYIVQIKDVKLIEGQLMLVCDELGINDRIEKSDLLKAKQNYKKLAEAEGIELKFVR